MAILTAGDGVDVGGAVGQYGCICSLNVNKPTAGMLKSTWAIQSTPLPSSQDSVTTYPGGCRSHSLKIKRHISLGVNFELVLRSKVPEVVSSNSSAVSRKILSNLAASFPKVKVQPSEKRDNES